MTKNHPYIGLPTAAFWRPAVAERRPGTVEGLYRRRFEITQTDRIATAGSCFAQHIARRLRQNGYSVLDLEPAPRGMGSETQLKLGYGLYSARYGNIYTVRQFLQLLRESLGKFEPVDAVWQKEGRWFDALRPSVEPDGLDTPEDVIAHRRFHLRHVKNLMRKADVVIFTLGLTEAWVHRASGTVYPLAPGIVAGTFDPEVYEFKNFSFEEITADFRKIRMLFKRANPAARFILTVSPVPLAATASGDHVLAATMRSKSILRAATSSLVEEFEDVDYFPSYELIASPFSEGRFFAQDRRNVTGTGVDTVMRVFFSEHPPHAVARTANGRERIVDE